MRFGEFQPARIHQHDTWHYQMGSKYAEELGYDGIYESTVAVLSDLSETGDIPQETVPKEFRDLTLKSGKITVTPEVVEAGKARFSPERWQEFRADIIGWHHTLNFQAWNKTVNDAGYNPSPWWSVVGKTANLFFPNSHSLLWAGMMDMLILAGCIILVARTFGSIAAAYATLLIGFFPAGEASWFNYTGMSFLRLSWMAWFTAAVCAFHTKRFLWAGAFVATATMERVFPGAWAFAGGATLLTQWIQNTKHVLAGKQETLSKRELKKARQAGESSDNKTILFVKAMLENKEGGKPLRLFVIGGILATLATATISCIIVGPSLWADFIQFIPKHGKLLWANHFGWIQAITIHPGMKNVETPKILQEWSDALMQRDHWLRFILLKSVLMGGIIVWALKNPSTKTMGWLGLGIIFFVTLPAQYYLVGMLPIYAATFQRKPEENTESKPIDYFPAWILGIAAATSCFTATGGNLPWTLGCFLILTALAAGIASTLTEKYKTTAAIVGACITIAIVFLSPQWQKTPGTKSNEFPAKIDKEDTSYVTQSFLDATSSKEITDEGLVIPAGKGITVTTETRKDHTLHLRTDQFYGGVIRLSTPDGRTVSEWWVDARGGMFFTYSVKLPNQTQYRLEWVGPGKDIGIFSIWTTKN